MTVAVADRPPRRQKGLVVTALDFAELVGKDRTTVQAWMRQGMPARHRGAGRAHQIDVGAAVQWLLARAAADCEERLAAERGNGEASVARVSKLRAEARLAELDVKEREGELVVAAEAEQRWAAMVVAARERLLALPVVALQQHLVRPEHEDDLRHLVDDALAELAQRGKP